MDAHDDLSRPGVCKASKTQAMNFVSTRPPPAPKRQNLHRKYKRIKVLKNTKNIANFVLWTITDGSLMILGAAEKSPSIDRSIAPPTNTAPAACKPNRVSFSSFFSFARPAAFRVCFGDCPGERFCVKRCGVPYGGSYPAGHTYGHLHIRYSKRQKDN
jgi:hypothetical protein